MVAEPVAQLLDLHHCSILASGVCSAFANSERLGMHCTIAAAASFGQWWPDRGGCAWPCLQKNASKLCPVSPFPGRNDDDDDDDDVDDDDAKTYDIMDHDLGDETK